MEQRRRLYSLNYPGSFNWVGNRTSCESLPFEYSNGFKMDPRGL